MHLISCWCQTWAHTVKTNPLVCATTHNGLQCDVYITQIPPAQSSSVASIDIQSRRCSLLPAKIRVRNWQVYFLFTLFAQSSLIDSLFFCKFKMFMYSNNSMASDWWTSSKQWQRQEFSLGGPQPRGLGTEVPRWAHVPQKLKHCLQILTTGTIKIWKFHTIYRLILDQYVSWWGQSNPIGEGVTP